jgi:23S rRNA (adenine2503-C2)-methyltransferase
MKITRRLSVPTGDILIGDGERGPLEFLSLGDYGQHVNLNQHRKVAHQAMLHLSEKWVVTVSTQYGCPICCEFCDVSRVSFKGNATAQDLIGQVQAAMSIHPEVRTSDRLNVHFARMGEPTFNPAVFECAKWLRSLEPAFLVHPVVSTMMPAKNARLASFLQRWVEVYKNREYGGNAGLQLSINSTDEMERRRMFRGNALSLPEISDLMAQIEPPVGRKFTLNFAVAGYEINPDVLLRHFSPDHYVCKLTPMHKTAEALQHGVKTAGDYTDFYPYQQHEERLKQAGYDVLTFIASAEEDLGRITCGNAILSGTLPLVDYREVRL